VAKLGRRIGGGGVGAVRQPQRPAVWALVGGGV